MATLITGGAGFVGSHLAQRLIAAGDEVVVIDNLDPYYNPAIKKARLERLDGAAEVIIGDIRNGGVLERIFKTHKIERVAHLAAQAGVRHSISRSILYTEVNVIGTVTMLEAARRHDVGVFVQASTSSVYGNTTRIPFREEDPVDFPLAPYPASKRAAELYAYTFHRNFGLDVTILRFFNVYGPDGRPDMMPLRVIESICNGESIPVYGGGGLERDWTYIDDTVDGLIAALERPRGYNIINLGYGKPVSLLKFIAICQKLIGKPALTHDIPTPRSEPIITYCDNTRAQRILNFKPKVDVAEGMKRTWEWYRQVNKLDRP
jgi:UDP-glucuronate 4-epimerase